MKTLVLIRHTKAEPQDLGQSDFDRPLALRGLEDAVALGDWLRLGGHLPAKALVSPARRTRETWAGLATGADAAFPPALYDASAAAILRLVAAEGAADNLAVVGHNPGLGDAIIHLLRGETVPADLAAVPTGATAVIRLGAGSWAEAIERPGRLIAWTVPRRLRKAPSL